MSSIKIPEKNTSGTGNTVPKKKTDLASMFKNETVDGDLDLSNKSNRNHFYNFFYKILEICIQMT